jgi:DNA-binding transcriptional ArsR family regulator
MRCLPGRCFSGSRPIGLRQHLNSLNSVSGIAARVELPRGFVSHHLRLLRAGRYLRATRQGKQMIYASVDDRVRCILVDLVGHVVKPLMDDDDEEPSG